MFCNKTEFLKKRLENGFSDELKLLYCFIVFFDFKKFKVVLSEKLLKSYPQYNLVIPLFYFSIKIWFSNGSYTLEYIRNILKKLIFDIQAKKIDFVFSLDVSAFFRI